MPQLVDLGQPYGTVSFPDEYTPEQIVAEYNKLEAGRKATPQAPPRQADLSTGDYAKNIAGRLIRGAGSVIASIPESLGIAASGLSRLTGTTLGGVGEGDPLKAEDRAVYQLGQAIRRGTEAIAPATRPELDESFLASKLPEGVGSALGFMAGGGAGRLLKIPAWAGIGALGSAASGVDFYQDAKASGADEGTAQLASLVGNVVGTSEAFPLARMMRRLDNVTGGTFSKYVIEAGKDTLEEALQEGAQRLSQNFTAKQLYDADRTLFDDVAANSGVGGATGFLLSSLTQALGIPIARSKVRRERVDRRRAVVSQVARERYDNANQAGTIPGAPSQEEGLREEEGGAIRLRNPPQDGVEAEAGAPITPAPPAEQPPTTTTVSPPESSPDFKSPNGDLPPTPTNKTAVFAGYQFQSPDFPTFQIPGARPGILNNVTADAARAQGYDVPPIPTFEQWQAEQAAKTGPVVPPPTPAPTSQRAVVDQVVADVYSTWDNGPQITVVDDASQLPADVRADMPPGLSPDKIQGSVDRSGRVWLVASAIPDAATATRVIMEEAVGHLGVEAALGNRFDGFMAAVANRHADTPIGAEIRAAYGDNPITVGREIVSKLAQEPDADPSLWQRVVAAVRDWVRRVFKVEVSDNDLRVLLSNARRQVETGNKNFAAQPAARFAVSPESSSTTFFPRRASVTAATSSPGLSPSQIQEAEDLAAVQANMVTQDMVNWLVQIPADRIELSAQGILDYLLGRATLSPTPRPLSSLPAGTTEEQRTKELAGANQLAHYAYDREKAAEIDRTIDEKQVALTAAVAKTQNLSQTQHTANYLTAVIENLFTDYNQYLVNREAAAPAAQNLQAQWRAQTNVAQERLNEQAQSPTVLRNSLSAIARTIPDAVLNAPGATNQDIINWVIQNGALFNVAGQQAQDWMLVNDGTGSPALAGYTRLITDLQTLKDILTNQAQVAADITAFEQWFRNSAQTGKIPAKAFADKYHKFRTGRDRALKIIAASQKEIDTLDRELRANIMARDRLESMMTDQSYIDAVRGAAEQAHIVVRALYGQAGTRTGLIDRDRVVGKWTLKGPETGTNYVVDLHPSSAQETQNRLNLSAWMSEARQWAATNEATDPLLADEYNNLAEYVERHLMSPSFDPKQGFTTTRVRIPGTDIRMPIDPFDGITLATSAVGYSFNTVRDVMERIGGRTMKQAFADALALDTVMRKVEGIDANKTFGRAAQTQAVLKAMASHGWNSDQLALWDEKIAEPILAAAQNRLSPMYEVGDYVVGADTRVTAEDLTALRLMKQWGDAIISVAPHHVQEKLADLGITRKAIGNGRFTGHRIAAPWVEPFVNAWNAAPDAAAKAALLAKPNEFRRVVLGYLAEFNPEFAKMNPASKDKSPLFDVYRLLALTEKQGVQTFRSWADVIDFLATAMVQRGTSPDYVTAAATAQDVLFTDISRFIETFDREVIKYENKDPWGGVPPEVVAAVSARNPFTTPRSRLVAPSTFYSYSTASEGRRQGHTGGLRSLLNLKLLQSGVEATKAMEVKKKEITDRIEALKNAGASLSQARSRVQGETARARALGDLRFDYRELLTALQAVEKSFGEVRRYELQTNDHYEHAGVSAMNQLAGTMKSSLLSSTQAMTTNFWSGALLGPALAHWQSGQFLKAAGDVILPVSLGKTILKRVAAMVDGNPMMMRLLNQHGPLFQAMAQKVAESAADWRRIQHIAQSSGMVNPYNLGTVLKNQKALRSTAGRLIDDDPHRFAEWANQVMTAPGIRHATETLKATVPRTLDNAINYVMIVAWDREVEFLKKVGWAAFQAREQQATGTNTDYRDLTNKDNVLQPGDIGLKTNKALEWYRQLFVPLGSLDAVLLDYYERTKQMTEAQREAEPLLNDDDHAALALQYASKSNVSTETNRPGALKGKGSDGVWRNIIGTFMGWSINMMHQLSKGLQAHSKDPQFPAIANAMIGIATIVVLLAAVGAWNWEFGDELTKKLYDVSSARVQPGNVKDWSTALLYFAQSLVNTVPIIGSSIGGLAGVAYTGRGNPFDMTSLSPHIGFAAGVYNTARRISQTGDATLPLSDFVRQWIPMSKVAMNRFPLIRGLVDQQNVIRSLNASAPPGTEIKWGKRGSGDAKYGPANDELQKLIASAYEASAHGGSVADVQARMQDAIAAYMAAGRSQPDAVKALTAALSAKEPIRVLTGREMTPDEEKRWVARMTTSQKADYARATAAWRLLGAVTGKDLNMVTAAGGGGGGGGVIASRAITPTGVPRGTGGQSVSTTGYIGAGSRGSGTGIRTTRIGSSRRRSLGRRVGRSVGRATRTRRRSLGPRVSRRRTSRVGTTRRRRSYA